MRSFRLALLCALFMPTAAVPAAAKSDWQSDLHKWAVSSQSDSNCKTRYSTGVYRPDLGPTPVWGLMTEKMFKWFSRVGAKVAPSVCPASRATLDAAEYRILFSASPMTTVSQTTHGSEVQTTTQPFNASVNSQTTYFDGGIANSTATISGEQTTTVVVPTETTISRSSVALYMYTYHVKKGQLELIATDSVVFSRVAANGSGDNAAGAELGAGIGNFIRASGDRHRVDKLYEEALKAISADAQDSAVKQNTNPENRISESAPTGTQGAPAAVAPIQATIAPSASPAPAQALANGESIPSAESIDTPKQHAATDEAETQFHIGTLYETGKGVPQDYTQTVLWYRKAADQGDAKAEYRLGVLYANGVGVPQDKTQAAGLFLSAAKHGYAPAYALIGGAYLTGDGVSIDYAEASFWFSVATVTEFQPTLAKADAMQLRVAGLHLSQADLSRVAERARAWLEEHPAKRN